MIAALIPFIGQVIDKLIPDPQAAADAKLKALELAQAGELADLDAQVKLSQAQTTINAKEAEHPSIFVAGWRPACGWVCVIGLGYVFLLHPMACWVSDVYTLPTPPRIDAETLLVLVTGMLGLGGYRTYEKVKIGK